MNEEETKDSREETEMGELQQNGLVRGIPGERIVVNGVLDLRGIPAQQVATIKSATVNGVIVMDEANRTALGAANVQINGSMMVADASLRIMTQPDIHLTKTMVEAMPAGQKLLLIGFVTIDPDVPGEVVAEKLEQLIIVGFLITTARIQGALFGRLEITGITILLKEDGGPVVRNMGQNTVSAAYLNRLQDGSTYINIGQTYVEKDVPEALVEQKIATYYNVGQTISTEPVMVLLKSRCDTNLGQMKTWEEEEGAQ